MTTGQWWWERRHAGHSVEVVRHPCGCESVVCADCRRTDGYAVRECIAVPIRENYPDGLHPALVAGLGRPNQ